MSAEFAKDEMTFVMPASVSRPAVSRPNTLQEIVQPKTVATEPVARANASPDRGAGLAGRIAAAVQWLVDMPRRRAVINELAALSSHELADIGLTRSDVPHVFDRGFITAQMLPRGAGN